MSGLPGAPSCAVIIGANALIASAIARELATMGWQFVLAGRDARRLQMLAENLLACGARGADVETIDLLEESSVDEFFHRLAERQASYGLVVVAAGLKISNEDCLRSVHLFRQMAETNFAGNAHCALRAADLLASRGGGEVVVISSVSGERGRPRNFFYGSTKAGLDVFLEGLRLALAGSGTNVMNLKPGPVGNRGHAWTSRDMLRASPESVARVVVSALGKGRHRVYAPVWWRYVMWLIRFLPGAVVAALRL